MKLWFVTNEAVVYNAHLNESVSYYLQNAFDLVILICAEYRLKLHRFIIFLFKMAACSVKHVIHMFNHQLFLTQKSCLSVHCFGLTYSSYQSCSLQNSKVGCRCSKSALNGQCERICCFHPTVKNTHHRTVGSDRLVLTLRCKVVSN